MKKIVMVIVAVALIAAGVFGTLAVQRTFEPSISLSSTSIQEQLSDCSELATAKLDYRGLVRYENGDIDFITKKAFTMVYDAEVRAGVDLAQARVEVSGNAITVSLPAPQLLGIEIDPNSLEFYDSSFALFNWENKQDTAEALKVAQQDAEEHAGASQGSGAYAGREPVEALHRRRQRLYGDGGRPIATRARRRAALEPPFFLQRNRSPYASSFSLNASSPNVISLPALRHSRYSDVAVNSTSDDELSAVSHES